MELARVLLCERKSAEWNCPCRSCEMNRLYLHPALAITGPDNFEEEILSAGNILMRHDRKAAAYMFIRAVRKVIRRFDPWVWEGKEKKEKKIEDAISQIEEQLSLVYPDQPRPEPKKLENIVAACTEKALSLAGEIGEDNIPVNSVRAVNSWVHTTGESENKIVIIENGDRMADSSRNALLKTLEEPPRGVYFILITTHKGRLIQTILSRLRHYHFPDRSAETEREVLSRIFREESGEYDTIASYFLGWRSLPVKDLHSLARDFLENLFVTPDMYGDFIPRIEALIKTKEHARLFLSQCQDILFSRFTTGIEKGVLVQELGLSEKWVELMGESLTRIESFNQKPSFAIESLFYTMRGLL